MTKNEIIIKKYYPSFTAKAITFSIDDGELKFFCFGVHSSDFERANKWEMLSSFAKKHGNRPQDFFYGSVGEIFDYEDAMNSLLIEDGKICNPSDKRL